MGKMSSEVQQSTSKPTSKIGTGIVELNQSILPCFYNLEKFVFYTMKIGESCNGKDSVCFTDAKCDFQYIRHPRFLPKCVGFPFSHVFSRGFELLQSLCSGDRVLADLEEYERTAIVILNDFLANKELAAESLNKVLKRHESASDCKKVTGAEITVVLAEHFLGKLCPGKSYVIDSKTKNKGGCSCGCGKTIKYGETGIGHELVWHGFVDVMFSSYEGLPESVAILEQSKSASCTESSESLSLDKGLQSTDTDSDNSSLLLVQEEEEPRAKMKKIDDTYERTNGSPGGRCITEVKSSENQAISQAIVFSMLQRQRHPDSPNHLIPNIVISPNGFYVIMYESKLDILICSNRFPIFYSDPKFLNMESVIALWMVLHYRLFSTGINENKLDANMELSEIKSNFHARMSEKLKIYLHELKCCVSYFPSIEQISYPSDDFFWNIINVMTK